MSINAGGCGLSPSEVSRWKRRIGADKVTSPAISPIELAGRQGLAAYCEAFGSVEVKDPNSFGIVAYLRKLSVLQVYTELNTARRRIRDSTEIRRTGQDFVMAGVHLSDQPVRVTQNGREYAYVSGDLVAVNSWTPFSVESTALCETSMVVIPIDLLHVGSDIFGQPIIAKSSIARATAQFIRRFVCEAVTEVSGIDSDDEFLLIGLLRSALNHESFRPTRGTGSTLIHEAVHDLIENRYRDPNFTADTIAGILHISRRHLYRHFAATDETPAAMITSRRLDRAREILSSPDAPNLESVAAESGFTSAATLRNRFRAEFGLTPREFRDQIERSMSGLSRFPTRIEDAPRHR